MTMESVLVRLYCSCRNITMRHISKFHCATPLAPISFSWLRCGGCACFHQRLPPRNTNNLLHTEHFLLFTCAENSVRSMRILKLGRLYQSAHNAFFLQQCRGGNAPKMTAVSCTTAANQ